MLGPFYTKLEGKAKKRMDKPDLENFEKLSEDSQGKYKRLK